MPSISHTSQEEPTIASVNYVKGAMNEVYTKKAIDEAIQSMVNALTKVQAENEELKAQLENINIKFINISPFQKFKNLFRSVD